MTKNTRKLIIAVLMLVVVCLYFVSGTYARYASEITGNAKVSTAKWAVAFKNGSDTLSNNFNLTFTVAENTNVVSGKIAPATTATATIEADLNGTEVAVDYNATIDESSLTTLFGASADDVTVTTSATVGGSADSTGTIALPGGAAFDSTNGKVVITITLTWTNDDTNNTSDTSAAGKDLTLPVTLTLKQHI